ncbi:MAG TPA: 2OG-Fe(II) oxygenase [Burkholderiales bacterium]|nr:2OG-Fe(II) oxygenase [Burkholderiales bacterium]
MEIAFEPLPVAEADAAHVLAMRAAEGPNGIADWQTALNFLQRSAELGSTLAQAELSALAGDWLSSREILDGRSRPDSDWAKLRRSVDIGRWLEPSRRLIMSASPRIAAIEGFASAELCDWLIARARPKLAPAQVYDHDTGGPRSESVRTNSECHFPRDRSDLLLLTLRARMATASELPVHAMEAPAVLHYTPGQEFLPHYDFLDTNLPGPAKEVARAGKRVLTFLVVLNDDYAGGETDFPELGKRWKGRKGSALFFWNVQPDGKVDRGTLHAGLPPTSGEKWLLSQWVRVPALKSGMQF